MALHPRVSLCENVAEGFRTAAAVYPDNTAQMFRTSGGDFDGSRTYSELCSVVSSLSESLIDIGFSSGGRAGIMSATRPEWNIADLAILTCGGATAGIYTSDNIENIEHKIQDSQLSIIFTDTEKNLRLLLELPQGMVPCLNHIISFDPPPEGISDKRVLYYRELVDNESSTDRIGDRISAIKPSATARIVYTSGTGGKAKGAILSHKNLVSNMRSVAGLLDFGPGDITFSHLPTAHILQTLASNLTLFCGGALAYSGKKTFQEDLRAARPTILPGVPRIFKNLMAAAGNHLKQITGNSESLMTCDVSSDVSSQIRKQLGLDRIEICISGAAKLDERVEKTLREKLGLTILEGYGMSETSPVIAMNTLENNRPGTVGKVIPGVSVRIVDEEGRELPHGIQGEIEVSGDGVFSGYLNLPIVNASVLTGTGAFYTGDLGFFDHDNYLKVIGRKGNQVKFANGNYYDLEKIAEDFLGHTFLIQQAAAAGEQKDFPVAVISLAEDLEIALRYADSLGISYNSPYDLVYNEKIIEAIKNEFHSIKKSMSDRHSMEKIHKVLYVRPFSPANGEATATGKVRVKRVLATYIDEIEKLYEDETDFRVLKMSRRSI